MNPMRIGGGNRVDGTTFHNSFSSVGGTLTPSTGPVYVAYPSDYKPDNPHMPSQLPRLPYLEQVRASMASRMVGVRGRGIG
jgi:hypothetical protein